MAEPTTNTAKDIAADPVRKHPSQLEKHHAAGDKQSLRRDLSSEQRRAGCNPQSAQESRQRIDRGREEAVRHHHARREESAPLGERRSGANQSAVVDRGASCSGGSRVESPAAGRSCQQSHAPTHAEGARSEMQHCATSSPITAHRIESVTQQLRDPCVASHEAHRAMRGGIMGVGTDEARLLRCLEGKSAPEITALREVYRERYHRDLSLDVRSELRDNHRLAKHAEALLHGDQLKATISTLHTELTNPRADAQAVIRQLERLTPSERAEVRTQVNEALGGRLNEALEKKLSGVERHKIEALLSNDPAKAAAADLHHAIRERDPVRLMEALSKIDPAQMPSVLHRYQELYREPLSAAIATAFRLPPSSIDCSTHSFAMSTTIESLIQHRPMREIYTLLRDLSPQSVGAISAALEQHSGRSLAALVTSRPGVTSVESEVLTALATQRAPDPAVLARHLLSAPRVDTALLLHLIEHSPAESWSRFHAKFNVRIEEAAQRHLTPAQQFEVKAALAADRTTAQGVADLINARLQYDRKIEARVIDRALDLLSDQGRQYDRSVGRLNQEIEKLNQSDPLIDGDESEGILEQLIAFCKGDRESYREAKARLQRILRSSVEVVVGCCGALVVYEIVRGEPYALLGALLSGAAAAAITGPWFRALFERADQREQERLIEELQQRKRRQIRRTGLSGKRRRRGCLHTLPSASQSRYAHR